MQDLDSHDELDCKADKDTEAGDDASSTSARTADQSQQEVDDDDRRGRLQWRLEEVRVIKYGTLGRLVAALSDDSGQMDVSNVNIFLTTCRTFASTGDVVEELIKRSVGESIDQSISNQSRFLKRVNRKTTVYCIMYCRKVSHVQKIAGE